MRVCRGDEVVLEETASSSSVDALRSVAGDILDLDRHRHRPDVEYAGDQWMVEEVSKRRLQRHSRHVRHERDSGLSEDSCDDTTGHTESYHGRRCVCSRTLRRQQRQLDHVTALCRRALIRNQSSSDDLQQPGSPTQHQKMKVKPSECETYKLIESKLEELQRLYATRPPVTPAEITQCYRVNPGVRTTPRTTEGRILDTDRSVPTSQRCRETAVGNSLPKLAGGSPESTRCEPECQPDKHRGTSACCVCVMLHRLWTRLKQLLSDFT